VLRMPPANHDLHVKLTLPQKKKIAENAQVAGFNSVSDFVRHITLEEGYTMEQRIREIHEAILGQNNQAKRESACGPSNLYKQNKILYNHVTEPHEYGSINEHYDSEL